MPMAAVTDSLGLLLDKRLVVAVGSTPETYLPGRAPERIEVQSVLDALRRTDRKPDPLAYAPAPGQSVARALAAVEQAGARKLDGLTVKDLLLEQGPPVEPEVNDLSVGE